MSTEPTTPATPAPAPTGLGQLRVPVESRYIAKLPKPTRSQTEAVRDNKVKPIKCPECHAWHHPEVQHLDYVGHAATTARLLEVDENWTWEPVAFDKETGLPKFDHKGGLWIRLTILGQTRLGYGNADDKTNSDAGAHEKECIGDAIRNAAMRFGWALELWHKGGDLFLPGVYDTGDTPTKKASEEEPFTRERAMKNPFESPRSAAPAKTGKPPYPDKQLASSLPAWEKSFVEQTANAKRVIAKIETRYTMTAKQRAQIKAAEVRALQPKKD